MPVELRLSRFGLTDPFPSCHAIYPVAALITYLEATKSCNCNLGTAYHFPHIDPTLPIESSKLDTAATSPQLIMTNSLPRNAIAAGLGNVLRPASISGPEKTENVCEL